MSSKITKDLVEEVNECVFHYFRKISNIPRGSGNEKAIADYLMAFSDKYGFKAIRSDENEYVNGKKTNNVVIFKPATEGYDDCETVILQAHNDMVCEKVKGSGHDFEKDPIKYDIVEKDGIRVLKADGTTLGGDNGIGMAYALAILASGQEKSEKESEEKSECPFIPHPAINALFTSDEEAGMSGAIAVTAKLLDGIENKCLINVDTEEEGVLFNGCAGAIDANFRMPVTHEPLPEDYVLINIELSGLLGGHSGIDIHRKRANANILMARTLRAIADVSPMRIAVFTGGTMKNAITREAGALIGIPSEKIDGAIEAVRQCRSIFEHEYRYIEVDKDGNSNIVLTAAMDSRKCESVLSHESTDKLINAILLIPNGVLEMLGKDGDYDLVETSCNLGYIRQESNHIFFSSFVRSFIRTKKLHVVEQMKSLAVLLGAEFTATGDFPSWEPDNNSKLKVRLGDAYKAAFGVEAEVKSVHAGLECGYFAEKFPGMDMISCGPTLKWVHTPDEIMHVDTVIKVTELLLRVLEDMNKKVVVADTEAGSTSKEILS